MNNYKQANILVLQYIKAYKWEEVGTFSTIC